MMMVVVVVVRDSPATAAALAAVCPEEELQFSEEVLLADKIRYFGHCLQSLDGRIITSLLAFQCIHPASMQTEFLSFFPLLLSLVSSCMHNFAAT